MKLQLEGHISINKLIALVYALIPFTQNYKIPFLGSNLAFASALGIGVVFLLYSIMHNGYTFYLSRAITIPTFVVMFCYCILHFVFSPPMNVYNPISNNIIAIIMQFTFILVCILVFNDTDVRNHYMRYIEVIAIAMSVVVLLQHIIYIFLGTAITVDRAFLLPFRSLFTDSVKYTVQGSLMIINGLFRPSAFFLEPAHFSQFCLIGLASSLARNDLLFNKKAIAISIGIILTTSGIGIVSVVCLWVLKLLVNGQGITNKVIARIFLGIGILVIMCVILFAVSNSFRMAVTRIFVASGGHNSAILGRLGNAYLLKQLNSMELLFGMGYRNIPTYGDNIQYYMTGIVELLYCQGIVGTFLFIICYFQMIIKSFRTKTYGALYTLIIYIPFLIGSANLVILSLVQYIPMLYITRQEKGLVQ